MKLVGTVSLVELLTVVPFSVVEVVFVVVVVLVGAASCAHAPFSSWKPG
jgi:hypothetical protein